MYKASQEGLNLWNYQLQTMQSKDLKQIFRITPMPRALESVLSPLAATAILMFWITHRTYLMTIRS